jgi:hypothetical protein
LIDLGISQKVLAEHMTLHETTFSRWLNQKRNDDAISVVALDGIVAFARSLVEAGTRILTHTRQVADGPEEP